MSYSVSHQNLAIVSRKVEKITKTEVVTNHKFRVPSETAYLRVNINIGEHSSILNKVVTEIN